jgi:hypothetical protein
LNTFDNSQRHYYNLCRLVLEGRAKIDIKLIQYAYEYLNQIRELEKSKIESLTKYLVENFEHHKKMINDELNKKNKDRVEEADISVEWVNKSNNVKLGFWINSDIKYRDTSTKFKNIQCQIMTFHRSLITMNTIIRFYWTKNDIRELQLKEYCPYITISGVYFVDQIYYPQKSLSSRSWDVRELVGNKYKSSSDKPEQGFAANMKIRFKMELPATCYVTDLETILIGKYEEKTSKWIFDNIEILEFVKEKKTITFYMNELATFSVLLERKISFPYKSWEIRCIDDHTAILDLESINIYNISSSP